MLEPTFYCILRTLLLTLTVKTAEKSRDTILFQDQDANFQCLYMIAVNLSGTAGHQLDHFKAGPECSEQ